MLSENSVQLFHSTGDPNLAALKAEQAAAANANSNNSEQNNQAPAPLEETTPRGLNTWREATARAHTSAQLAMALYMLEASIAWDKSIMKAVSLTTARNSVCAKLRNRCVSLKATNQYKQLLTTSQTSVGIRTNLLTEIVLCYSRSLYTLIPSCVCLAHRESVRRFERISAGVCSTRRLSLYDILFTRRCSLLHICFQCHQDFRCVLSRVRRTMARKFAYIR